MKTKIITKEDILRLRARETAEEATGIRERGELEFYKEGGKKITDKQAKKIIREGKTIEAAGAGAGSYYGVYKRLGFEDIREIETASSAGDWTFAVKDSNGWRLAWQENRYPYYGFRYSISKEFWGYTTFEDLVSDLENFYY